MNEMKQSGQFSEEEFSLGRVFRKYIRKFPWFILSFLLFGGLAFLYLYTSTPLYRIQSSLVIKDEKKGESISLTLKELDFLDEQKIVDNEAEIVRSETIIRRVVDHLDLNIGYFVRENFLRKFPVYDESPIEVKVVSANHELYKEPIKVDLTENDIQLEGVSGKFGYGDTIRLFQTAAIQIQKKEGFHLLFPKMEIHCSDPDLTTQQLRASLAASTPSKNSSVLYVSLLHPSRTRGTRILEQIIAEYDLSNILEKRNQTDSIIRLIENRLQLIGDQLNSLESKEESYKEGQGITFLSDDARSFLDQEKINTEQLVEAKTQLDNLTRVEEYAKGSGSLVTPPNTSLNDPILTNIVTQLNQLELEKQKVLKKSGPQHPSVIALNQQATELRKNLLSNINIQRRSIQERISLLNQSKAKINSGISRVPASERNLLALMREKTIRENIYTYLLEKREEASLSDASVFSKMRIVDEAFSTVKPVKPKKSVIIGLALFLALLVPILLIEFRGILNRKINPRFVSQKQPYHVLGYIPHLKNFNWNVYDSGETIAAERFRWIRTSIEKMNAGKEWPVKVILVGSPSENEGKSFVTYNLAQTFSRMGYKTLLVDMDLRKQKLASLYPTIASGEFLEYLRTGEAHLNLLIAKGTASTPDILSGNYPVPKDQEVFQPGVLKKMFEQLRSQYDYVIINTAPFLLFTDSYLLESFSDLNLVILRHQYTGMDQVESLVEFVENNNMKKPHIIYNDVPLRELLGKKQLKSYYKYA